MVISPPPASSQVPLLGPEHSGKSSLVSSIQFFEALGWRDSLVLWKVSVKRLVVSPHSEQNSEGIIGRAMQFQENPALSGSKGERTQVGIELDVRSQGDQEFQKCIDLSSPKPNFSG